MDAGYGADTGLRTEITAPVARDLQTDAGR